MSAANYDFTGDNAIEQGATFFRRMVWRDSANVPVNLTNYTARMQVRASVTSTIVLLELATANGGIVLGGALGTIDLKQTAIQTAVYDWKKGVYDLELVSLDGTVTRLMKGAVEVSREVTRP